MSKPSTPEPPPPSMKSRMVNLEGVRIEGGTAPPANSGMVQIEMIGTNLESLEHESATYVTTRKGAEQVEDALARGIREAAVAEEFITTEDDTSESNDGR